MYGNRAIFLSLTSCNSFPVATALVNSDILPCSFKRNPSGEVMKGNFIPTLRYQSVIPSGNIPIGWMTKKPVSRYMARPTTAIITIATTAFFILFSFLRDFAFRVPLQQASYWMLSCLHRQMNLHHIQGQSQFCGA